MRVLVLGGDGMLGHKVFQVFRNRFEAFATFRHPDGMLPRYPIYADARPEQLIHGVDAMDLDSVIRSLARAKPNVVINCIGIVKQLEDAKNPLMGIAVNSLFPHRLAQLCSAAGVRLLHVSTDCVFSGRKGCYTEDDVPDADDLYGRTKLLGEVSLKGCLTIRTSIIGRDFRKQSALLEWLLSNRNGRVKGYVNAIYSGFPTQVFARIMEALIVDYPDLSGLYHVSSDAISKYDLLVKIRDALKLDIEIESDGGFCCDRSLDSSRFRTETGYPIPGWDSMIAELAQDDTPYDEYRRRYGNAR
jgi:dTDP-4-dehydrorhamnose reductase